MHTVYTIRDVHVSGHYSRATNVMYVVFYCIL